MQLSPGSYAATLRGDAEIAAFGEWLDANGASVRLFEKEGTDALIFTPNGVEELAVFQVFEPVEWTLSAVPVPAEFAKELRPDAVPSQSPESPAKGKPEGQIPGFGGDLLSGNQLVWLLLLGLYVYYSKGNRS